MSKETCTALGWPPKTVKIPFVPPSLMTPTSHLLLDTPCLLDAQGSLALDSEQCLIPEPFLTWFPFISKFSFPESLETTLLVLGQLMGLANGSPW